MKDTEKSMYENSFIQKCLNGEAELSELDNYIEYWHTHDVKVSLRDYLGLTPDEYEEWKNESDSIFKDILRRRKREKAINEWLDIHCPKCANNDDRGTDFLNCQAECEVQKDIGIACIHYEEAWDIESQEGSK